MKFEKKYAPTTIDEFVFPTIQMKATVQRYIAEDMDGHLLLHGSFGSGKTTLANLLPFEVAKKRYPDINEVWFDTMAGNEVNVAALTKIKAAVELVHLELPCQVIVIDEADTMTPQAMQGMKKLIDDTEAYCSFIFCTNHIDKIDGGIRSRCVDLPFNRTDVPAMTNRARSIMREEGVPISEKKLEAVVHNSRGDYRKLLQMLEEICFQLSSAKAA
jgi:DNA polymerase III delta prime subunit